MKHYLVMDGMNEVGCIKGEKALKLIHLLTMQGFDVVNQPVEECSECMEEMEENEI